MTKTNAKTSPETDTDAPAPQLSASMQARLSVASYLESLAKMVMTGDLTAFDIAWFANSNDQAPQGSLALRADAFRPMPKTSTAPAKASNPKIHVEDLSEKLKGDFENCGDPECKTCASRS